MLAPYSGSQARKVLGLLTGVCKYIFEVQLSPDGHGVGRGRKTVGVPPTVKTVDAMLTMVRELMSWKVQLALTSSMSMSTATFKRNGALICT